MQYGYNDETTVYCCFCNWTHPITSFEQAEHFLKEHLSTIHNKILLYAIETEIGIRKETP